VAAHHGQKGYLIVSPVHVKKCAINALKGQHHEGCSLRREGNNYSNTHGCYAQAANGRARATVVAVSAGKFCNSGFAWYDNKRAGR
jgi:hypothetical protein